MGCELSTRRAGANSQLRWAVAALGSRLHWTAQSVLLSEPGSEAHLYGLVFADGRQHLDIRRGRTTSRRTRRAICSLGSALLDRARTVLRGWCLAAGGPAD